MCISDYIETLHLVRERERVREGEKRNSLLSQLRFTLKVFGELPESALDNFIVIRVARLPLNKRNYK